MAIIGRNDIGHGVGLISNGADVSVTLGNSVTDESSLDTLASGESSLLDRVRLVEDVCAMSDKIFDNELMWS